MDVFDFELLFSFEFWEFLIFPFQYFLLYLELISKELVIISRRRNGVGSWGWLFDLKKVSELSELLVFGFDLMFILLDNLFNIDEFVGFLLYFFLKLEDSRSVSGVDLSFSLLELYFERLSGIGLLLIDHLISLLESLELWVQKCYCHFFLGYGFSRVYLDFRNFFLKLNLTHTLSIGLINQPFFVAFDRLL